MDTAFVLCCRLPASHWLDDFDMQRFGNKSVADTFCYCRSAKSILVPSMIGRFAQTSILPGWSFLRRSKKSCCRTCLKSHNALVIERCVSQIRKPFGSRLSLLSEKIRSGVLYLVSVNKEGLSIGSGIYLANYKGLVRDCRTLLHAKLGVRF